MKLLRLLPADERAGLYSTFKSYEKASKQELDPETGLVRVADRDFAVIHMRILITLLDRILAQ